MPRAGAPATAVGVSTLGICTCPQRSRGSGVEVTDVGRTLLGSRLRHRESVQGRSEFEPAAPMDGESREERGHGVRPDRAERRGHGGWPERAERTEVMAGDRRDQRGERPWRAIGEREERGEVEQGTSGWTGRRERAALDPTEKMFEALDPMERRSKAIIWRRVSSGRCESDAMRERDI